MNKLGTTHTQIDEYSKKRTAEISEAVSSAIDKVVADTAAQQQKLLADANERSAAIEFEYKQRLQERVGQLDAEKAILLAELERSLNDRQEAILLKARQDIDFVQNAANQEKLAVFFFLKKHKLDLMNKLIKLLKKLLNLLLKMHNDDFNQQHKRLLQQNLLHQVKHMYKELMLVQFL